MVTINFEKAFDPVSIENDFSQMIFNLPQVDEIIEQILVKIDPHPDLYLV